MFGLVCDFSIVMNEPPQVKTAANLFRRLCYRYREELMAGIIVAGWDKEAAARRVPPSFECVCYSWSLGMHAGLTGVFFCFCTNTHN